MGNGSSTISSIQPIVANVIRGNYWSVKDQIAQLEAQCEHDPSEMAKYLNGHDKVMKPIFHAI